MRLKIIYHMTSSIDDPLRFDRRTASPAGIDVDMLCAHEDLFESTNGIL